jgi:hypothetical protein
MRRQPLRLLVALVLALCARSTYAVPAVVEAELRAVSCCTKHTGKPSTVPDARRCCAITSDADAPATLSGVPATPFPPALATLPGIVLAPPIAASSAPPLAVTREARDGPPLYLGLRTIRR